jgi:hypothetical protein
VATNSLPNPLSTNSILEPCQRSSDTLITTPSPTPTLQSVSQNRDTSVHDFFAAKHSKKGSPRRNKRIRLPSSPSRPDILVTSSNNVPETPPNQIPVSTNETTGQYHSTIDNLDSSTTQTTGMPRDITNAPLSPPHPSLPLSEVASQVDTFNWNKVHSSTIQSIRLTILTVATATQQRYTLPIKTLRYPTHLRSLQVTMTTCALPHRIPLCLLTTPGTSLHLPPLTAINTTPPLLI